MIAGIATYLPAWADAAGRRTLGPDEDVVTAAVAVGSLVGAGATAVDRVAIVTQDPQVTEGFPSSTVRLGLGLPEAVPVSLRLGGAREALEALLEADPRTLVIAVDADGPAAAGAVLLGDGPGWLTASGRVDRSLPARVRFVGDRTARVYDDARLVRERGWRPTVEELRAGHDGPVVVAGLAESDVGRLGPPPEAVEDDLVGAASSVFALAALVERGAGGRIVAVGPASGTAADLMVRGDRPVITRHAPSPVPETARPRVRGDAVDIPFSLPAYERAWESKVGLLGGRCTCGAVSYPPRAVCLACEREGQQTLEPLTRDGEVYTIVTVHTAVPGVAGPYDLAIVALDGVDVRVLARVADAPAGRTDIGTRGHLVLRRVAVREGVPDYGYAFRPELLDVTEEVA